VPFAQAIEMVRDGHIKDAKSICALLLAREPNPRAAAEEAPEERDS
jgi:hypothetical protein